VIESGHSLILGWSPQVPQIIAELCIANESERGAAVVVLAKAPKVDMEEAIAEQVTDARTTRIVVRNGDPALPADLERACVRDARSIIAVRDADGDASVIKAVLAVRAIDPSHAACHVVAELNDDDTARTLRAVSGGRVVTVSSDAIVAEVTAQACYQSGLAAVFADLLDFDGDEIYFAPVPHAAGRAYAEVQLAFESSSVIGVMSANGEIVLNPCADRVLERDDSLILVASDDSAIAFSGFRDYDVPDVHRTAKDEPRPVRVLIVGWSGFGARVLKELDEFLVPGSSIHVQVDADLVDPSQIKGLELNNATLTARGGRGGPEDLLALDTHDRFDQVILLGYRDALPASDADARTLLSLLVLRMMWPADAPDHVRVVAELVDQRNAVIAAPAGIDDLIISDALASLMMAQLSERAELLTLFEDLFDPDGAVVVLLPAEDVVPAAELAWGSVVAAASRHRGSAFAYRRGATGEVVMNPSKQARVTLGAGDKIIAIGARAVVGSRA
jgi:K+/H+ antiporter YhaU regulatory subunit KhtT